jgi:hypothetical protein
MSNTHIVNDPVIDNQRFVCLSFLMPENIKDPETNLSDNKFNNKFRMLKVRGSFSTLEDAKNYAIKLRDDVEPHINVYVAEVGKWLPFSDDDSLSEDVEYREKQLNDLMKLHKEHLEKSKNYIKEKALADTTKVVEKFNDDNNDNNNTSTFDKINELKQKLNLIDENDKDNNNLNYFRDNDL